MKTKEPFDLASFKCALAVVAVAKVNAGARKICPKDHENAVSTLDKAEAHFRKEGLPALRVYHALVGAAKKGQSQFIVVARESLADADLSSHPVVQILTHRTLARDARVYASCQEGQVLYHHEFWCGVTLGHRVGLGGKNGEVCWIFYTRLDD